MFNFALFLALFSLSRAVSCVVWLTKRALFQEHNETKYWKFPLNSNRISTLLKISGCSQIWGETFALLTSSRQPSACTSLSRSPFSVYIYSETCIKTFLCTLEHTFITLSSLARQLKERDTNKFNLNHLKHWNSTEKFWNSRVSWKLCHQLT